MLLLRERYLSDRLQHLPSTELPGPIIFRPKPDSRRKNGSTLSPVKTPPQPCRPVSFRGKRQITSESTAFSTRSRPPKPRTSIETRPSRSCVSVKPALRAALPTVRKVTRSIVGLHPKSLSQNSLLHLDLPPTSSSSLTFNSFI